MDEASPNVAVGVGKVEATDVTNGAVVLDTLLPSFWVTFVCADRDLGLGSFWVVSSVCEFVRRELS